MGERRAPLLPLSLSRLLACWRGNCTVATNPPSRRLARVRAAVGGHDLTDDGEAQPRPAGAAVAGGVQAVERLEHRLQRCLRDAGAVVLDPYHDGSRRFLEGDTRPAPVLHGVVDKVPDGTLDRYRTEPHRNPILSGICRGGAPIGGIVHKPQHLITRLRLV